ncbi:MAG: hypothetical protein HY919_05370 [Elusimicrobia bacterium]|nr:hypothetical protein [Elusimicrobiota bacterium]
MKLIKNFRIALRRGYVFRDLKKKKIEISEEELSRKLKEIHSHLKSATVYETFNPAVFGKKTDFGKSIAVTLFAVTLGKEIETLCKNEILDASVKDGLEVCKNFILKLIQIEAEEEHCELLEPTEVEPTIVFENQKILSKMDFSKIGIKFESGNLAPVNTKLFVIGWLLKKKK